MFIEKKELATRLIEVTCDIDRTPIEIDQNNDWLRVVKCIKVYQGALYSDLKEDEEKKQFSLGAEKLGDWRIKVNDYINMHGQQTHWANDELSIQAVAEALFLLEKSHPAMNWKNINPFNFFTRCNFEDVATKLTKIVPEARLKDKRRYSESTPCDLLYRELGKVIDMDKCRILCYDPPDKYDPFKYYNNIVVSTCYFYFSDSDKRIVVVLEVSRERHHYVQLYVSDDFVY